MDNLTSWFAIGTILAAIFVGCAVVIKKFFLDKKYQGTSTFVGRQIYNSFQNADSKKNIEHVIYMEEEERQLDFTDEDNEN